jgi:two-component system response regulator AdeR
LVRQSGPQPLETTLPQSLHNKRILIAEDEPEIAAILQAFFAREQAQVLIAVDGADALNAAQYWRPDLVLLDIHLPQRDGLSVLAEWRGRGGPPVIIVTAMGEDVDRLLGFRLGCDDYVVKPFNPLEVVARAKAVLQRGAPASAPPSRLTLGGLSIDLDAHSATLHGAALSLTPTEFKILRLLAERAGRLVTRSQLVELAMGDDAFDKSVNPHISRLRQKLDEGTGPGRRPVLRVVSVQREGYRLDLIDAA